MSPLQHPITKPVYLLIGDETVGPLTLQDIRSRLKGLEINSTTLWAEEGGTEWKPLFELPGLITSGHATATASSPGLGSFLLWVVVGAGLIALFLMVVSSGGTEATVALVLLALALWPIPAFVAVKNKHPQTVAIVVLDLVAGWTFIGWVVALVWACTVPKR